MRTQEHRKSQQHSEVVMATGIIMLVLGIIALVSPWFLTSLAVELMYAWLLLVYGIVQLLYAFKSRSIGGFLLKLLFGIISIIAAILFVSLPIIRCVHLNSYLRSLYFSRWRFSGNSVFPIATFA